MFIKQENFDNKFMEEQIVSMLENVLDYDSDDVEVHKETSLNNHLFEDKENFLFHPDDVFWPEMQKETTFPPKILVNDIVFNSISEQPFNLYSRKEKKCNTADACISYNTINIEPNNPRRKKGDFLNKVHPNITSNYKSIRDPPLIFSPFENLQNNKSENSTLTTSSGNINPKSLTKANEDIPPNVLYWNEYDEILENNIRPKEELDNETYQTLKGKIFNVLMTQNGSRVLQKALKNTKYEIISQMLEEVSDKFWELMTDSYANYFCPKFFSYLRKNERIIFLIGMKNHMYDISVSKVGTYPLQSIIDQLKTDEEKIIVAQSFQGKILEMCLDSQGTHVIEKIITCFEEHIIEDCYHTIIDNILTLADNVNGLCVCKKIIIHAAKLKTMKRIREKLTENAIFLIQNVYGNYVIQMAIEKWSSDFCLPMISRFQNNLYFLSMQKYSSNVIEKCFEKGYDLLYASLIEEISNDSKIIDLIRSPFANYVIQKALKLSKGGHKKRLIALILKDLKKLEDKKLIAKWKLIVNNVQSSNKNITRPVIASNNQSNFAQVSFNSPNFGYNNPNMISNNNYKNNSRVAYGSPQFSNPYLMLNRNMNNNNNIYPNFVNNNANNYVAFSLNYSNNSNNYYL